MHDHRVSKNSTSQIEKSGDYSFLISLTNYENYKKYILIGNKNYKNLSNRDSWCQKDTIFQKNKVKEIVDGFLEVSEYAFLSWAAKPENLCTGSVGCGTLESKRVWCTLYKIST